jgi:hypothetical protein
MSYNYGDLIEYTDSTNDENFNNASRWAKEHYTTFTEDLELRNLPLRYFRIGEAPIPAEPPEVSEVSRREEILQELNEIDRKSIRALRANEADYIAMYEQQAQALREELQQLGEVAE